MGLTGPVQSNDIVMRASEIGSTIPGIASLAMKTARKGAQRGVQGIYQLPSGQEPTPEYMNVAQQSLNNQTQQMTDMLNSMAPEDERLAYINEEEAGILKLLGGSGDMTPQGIPSFAGNMSPGGDSPDLPPGQRGRKRYNPTTDGLPEGLGQTEIYNAYMDQLPVDNAARQEYFTTGNPTLPQTPTADKDQEMEADSRDTGFDNVTMPDPSDRFERGGTETGNYNISLPYIPGGPKGDFRTTEFRDFNNNGIDDRDEQPMGGSDYFDYMKYISGPKQAAAELAVTAPEGEFPAYINEDEAELLRMYGGSGTTSNNPAEIPSFFGHGSAMHGDGGGTNTGTGTGNGGNNGADKEKDKEKEKETGTGYTGPTARDTDGDGIADVDQDAATRAKAERNAKIVKAKATIRAGGGLLTDGEGGLVAAGRALDRYREQVAREAYAESVIDKTQDLANLGVPRDTAYATTGMPTAIGLQDASYGSFTDRQQELQDKARANTITNSELQELANLNTFEGENPTTGMGIVESLRYQATHPDLGSDLANLGNIAGIAGGLIGGTPIGVMTSLNKIYNKYKPKEYNTVERRKALAEKKKGVVSTVSSALQGLKGIGGLAMLGSNAPTFNKALSGISGALNLNAAAYNLSDGTYGTNPEGIFSRSIDKFKDRFGSEETEAEKAATTLADAKKLNSQYANLPDNYGGGNFGNNQGNNGGDPFIYTGNEETEEEKQIARDRFERAFAQRYFIGPTTLPEVRTYAVTGGGYNQLTPYGIG